MLSLRTGNTDSSDSEESMQKSKAKDTENFKFLYKVGVTNNLLLLYPWQQIAEILTKCSLNKLFISHIMGSPEIAVQCWCNGHQEISRCSHTLAIVCFHTHGFIL